MTNIQNACVLLIRELYKTEPAGGDLHIVTDADDACFDADMWMNGERRTERWQTQN